MMLERFVFIRSQADICNAKGHVRFTPESDINCVFACLLWAKSGHTSVTCPPPVGKPSATSSPLIAASGDAHRPRSCVSVVGDAVHPWRVRAPSCAVAFQRALTALAL